MIIPGGNILIANWPVGAMPIVGIGAKVIVTPAITLTPAAVWAALDKSSLADNPFFTLMCDLVIPDTSVPGAVKAGVPDFITLAAAHGMKGAKAEQITGFEALLNQHSGSVFVSLKEQE